MAASGSAKNTPRHTRTVSESAATSSIRKTSNAPSTIRYLFCDLIGLLASGLLAAQAQMQPIPPAPSNSEVTAAVKDASTWTRAKWNGMKAKWSLDKAKWADRLPSTSESAKACRAQKLARNRQLHDPLGRRQNGSQPGCLCHKNLRQ